MHTFLNFILNEDAVRQDAAVSSNAHSLAREFTKVINLLVRVSGEPYFEDRLGKSESILSELDLIEALDIVELVVQNRLAKETINSKEMGHEEWKGDKARGYSNLFDSIATEIKEALNNYFFGLGSRSKGFMTITFQQNVVEPMMEILSQAGPEKAKTVVSRLVNMGKKSIATNIRTQTAEDPRTVQKALMAYKTIRRQRLTGKKSKSLTKNDRKKINTAVMAAIEEVMGEIRQSEQPATPATAPEELPGERRVA